MPLDKQMIYSGTSVKWTKTDQDFVSSMAGCPLIRGLRQNTLRQNPSTDYIFNSTTFMHRNTRSIGLKKSVIVCWRAFKLTKAICSVIKSLALCRSDLLRDSENCKACSISLFASDYFNWSCTSGGSSKSGVGVSSTAGPSFVMSPMTSSLEPHVPWQLARSSYTNLDSQSFTMFL